MEPLSLLGAAATVIGKQIGSRVGIEILRRMAVGPSDATERQLREIDSKLARILSLTTEKDLRAGLSLVRDAIRELNAEDRRRRIQIAEDHFLVAADDANLPLDMRALAAFWLSICSADRGAMDGVQRWLSSTNALCECTLASQLYYHSSILAEDAPSWVRNAISDQERKASSWSKLVSGFAPEVGGLRREMMQRANETLAFWNAVRALLSNIVNVYSVPPVYIFDLTDHLEPYFKGKAPLPNPSEHHNGAIGVPLDLGSDTLAGAVACRLQGVNRGSDGCVRASGTITLIPDTQRWCSSPQFDEERKRSRSRFVSETEKDYSPRALDVTIGSDFFSRDTLIVEVWPRIGEWLEGEPFAFEVAASASTSVRYLRFSVAGHYPGTVSFHREF